MGTPPVGIGRDWIEVVRPRVGRDLSSVTYHFAKVDKGRLSGVLTSFTRVTNVSHLSPKLVSPKLVSPTYHICHQNVTFCVSMPTSTNAFTNVRITNVSLIDHLYHIFITICDFTRSRRPRTRTAERRGTIPQTRRTLPSPARQRTSTRKTNALPTDHGPATGVAAQQTYEPPSAPPRATRAAGGAPELSPRRRTHPSRP